MSLPENDLWASVMEQALTDLTNKAFRKKAVEWFTSQEYQLGSFLFICDALNLDPDLVLNFARKQKIISYAVNSVTSTSRVLFNKPTPQKLPDLAPLQRSTPLETLSQEELEALGARLSTWRKQQVFLTQEEAATQLGINQWHYSELERGKKQPTPQLAQRIQELLHPNADQDKHI